MPVTHPLNAMIGTACDVAEERVKLCADFNVAWSAAYDDGESSFVGRTQVYGDKSQASVSSSAVVFYLLHLTLFDFSEERGRKLTK